MLLMMMKEQGVSSPTEKLDKEGSLDVTSQQDDACMWGKERAACLFVPHSDAYRRVASTLA